MGGLTHARTTLALGSATVRYRMTIAARVRIELERWRGEAARIEDPRLRALALSKLEHEGFNAAAAAMLATLTPRSLRDEAVEAIVALEVLFDYLDGRTEAPSDGEPLEWRRALMRALVHAIDETATSPDACGDAASDRAYVLALARAVDRSLARLPTGAATRARLRGACERAVEAQARLHASRELGTGQLEEWARAQTNGSGLSWREYLAGSGASVLAMHVLIATSASDEEPERVDDAYLRIGALAALLDGVVDVEEDARLPRASYASLYASAGELQGALVRLAEGAAAGASTLRRAATHRMLLGGVLAYYTTTAARGGQPALATLEANQRALIAPAALVLSRWRRGRSDGG